jgi:hypothetical protein
VSSCKKASPKQRRWTVLEDNDPTGFKSTKAIRAKAEVGIETFHIPKRSPDLCALDYAVWTQVNKRMRRQEKNWPKGKRESRAEYATRLRRTALRLPKSFIDASLGDMRRRCQLLFEAKGHHFEEGGKKTKKQNE